MSEKNPGFYRDVFRTNKWVGNLILLETLGILRIADSEKLPSSNAAKVVAKYLAGAVETSSKSLKLEDVGRVGAEQLVRQTASEYHRPAQSLVKARNESAMFSIALRGLSQRGRVNYQSFKKSTIGDSYSVSEQETYWQFNETPQNILQQLARLERQLFSLIRNKASVAENHEETLRLGHFLSAVLSSFGPW